MILVVPHMEIRRVVLWKVHRDDDTVEIADFWHKLIFGAKVAIISFCQNRNSVFIYFWLKILDCQDKNRTFAAQFLIYFNIIL